MIRIKYILTLIFLSMSSYLFSQKQNNIWYFGDKAGLNFNTNPPTTLNDGVFTHTEGVSSICDKNGDLLFFTNGIYVWNANNEQMPNGFGLLGDNSSSQILIVPKPGDCNIYYIFTTPSQSVEVGAYYSIIDMRHDFGKGDVINKNIFLTIPAAERISATFQNNGTDYWIVLQELGTNKFLSFSLNTLGISSIPIISNSGIVNTQLNDAVGCMKFSHNGKKLCTANELGFEKCQLFDFDNLTGMVSNGFVISDIAAYGVEFSGDDSKLYLSSYRKFKLSQYDLSSNNPFTIKNSEVILVNQNTTGENGGSLQIGPDKKIYIARNNKNYLGVIQNPNSIGLNCNYVNNAISLNKICYAGLPNFLKNYPISFCGSLSANYSQSNLCPNNNFIITAHATFGASPYQYSIDSINFQASNVFPNLIPKKYVLTVKDVNLEIRKITVKIPDRIIFSLSTSSIKQPDCGYSNGEVTLTTSNGTGPFQYSKDGINFQLSNIFTDLPASTINFVVRDNNGCLTNVQTNIVAVNKFKIYAGKDTGIFIHQTVQLFANDLTNSNFISFKWLPATGLDNPFSQYPFATITNNIEYYVEAKTAQGCTVKDTIHIDVYKEIGIFVPSAFTPNFDNRNDVLKAIPRGIKQLNFFKIFDRFGAMVFSTNIFSIGWDGKNKGVNQNMGSYIWIAQGIDINGNVVYRKGSCTLLK